MTVPPSLSRFSGLWHSLTDLVFPKSCQACGAVLPPERRWLCADCAALAERVGENCCPRCGKPNPGEICYDCATHDFAFREARALWLYTPSIRALIHALKYQGMTRVAGALLDMAEDGWQDWPIFRDAETIVPIPLHPVRQRQRGYNQAECIARALSHRCGLPVADHAAIRMKATPSQTQLLPDERRKNLESAFHVEKPNAIRGKTVLIVDDVMTTGATVNSLSKALTTCGAREVLVFTIARAGSTLS